MPFESEKQRKYLWANKPDVAREIADDDHSSEGKSESIELSGRYLKQLVREELSKILKEQEVFKFEDDDSPRPEEPIDPFEDSKFEYSYDDRDLETQGLLSDFYGSRPRSGPPAESLPPPDPWDAVRRAHEKHEDLDSAHREALDDVEAGRIPTGRVTKGRFEIEPDPQEIGNPYRLHATQGGPDLGRSYSVGSGWLPGYEIETDHRTGTRTIADISDIIPGHGVLFITREDDEEIFIPMDKLSGIAQNLPPPSPFDAMMGPEEYEEAGCVEVTNSDGTSYWDCGQDMVEIDPAEWRKQLEASMHAQANNPEEYYDPDYPEEFYETHMDPQYDEHDVYIDPDSGNRMEMSIDYGEPLDDEEYYEDEYYEDEDTGYY